MYVCVKTEDKHKNILYYTIYFDQCYLLCQLLSMSDPISLKYSISYNLETN